MTGANTSSVAPIFKVDCRKGMSRLAEGSISMIFADPPYNLSHSKLENRVSHTGGAFFKVREKWDQYDSDGYEKFTEDWVSSAHRVLADNGAIYVCASHHNLQVILRCLESSRFSVKNILIWEKPNAMPNLTRRTFTHSVEFVVWAVRGKGWTFNFQSLREMNPDRQRDGQPKMLRDVWRIPVVQGAERLRGLDGRALHPTQKPEVLVARCVVASTNPGETILDPFCGSGTTGVVAARHGRRFIGFETDSRYVKAARLRISRALRNL